MKHSRNALMVILLVVAGMIVSGKFLSIPAGQAQMSKEVNSAQKWEYHTEIGNSSVADIQGRINRLGAEGWELSSVVYEPKTDRYIVFLKRHKG